MVAPLFFVAGGVALAYYLDKNRAIASAGGEGLVGGEKPVSGPSTKRDTTSTVNAAGQPIITTLGDAGFNVPPAAEVLDKPIPKPVVCGKFGGCGTPKPGAPPYQSPPIIALPSEAGGTVQAARIAIVSTKGMSTTQASQRLQDFGTSTRMYAF